MAQTNFTPILTYKSDTPSAVPSSGNLTNSANGAELAVNTADKRLFTKDSGGSVVELGTNPSSLTLPNGTANGVVYANASKVLTTGSALTFDGTNLGVGGASNTYSGYTVLTLNNSVNGPIFDLNYAGTRQATFLALTNEARIGSIANIPFTFYQNGSEQMRLTSTGLGIGTSNVTNKLTIGVASFSAAGTQSTGMYTDASLGLVVLSDGVYFASRAGAGRATLDSSGNLGLGVTPSAWNTASKAIQVSTNASFYGLTNRQARMGANHYYDTTGTFRYISTAAASDYQQWDGAHTWYTAPSGTAGNAISFTQALTLDANRNLLLNGTTAGASAVGTLAIFNGTAPTGSVTNGIILYAEDVSSSSELKVRDEAGNVTTLSPHNFSLIPEGPSEEMAWAYYSEKGGKRINLDMLKLARMVEKLTGEKLVYES